jgi:uncharacterized protein (DUF433 family)
MSTLLDSMLVRTPGVCGGRMRIDGTRITVHRIAVLYKQGQNAEEIAQTYPHLSLSQVYAALAFYHANRDEVEAELSADDAEYDALKSQPN